MTATKASDTNYNSATSAAATVSATKADQATLSVTGMPPGPEPLNATFTVGTSGGSGTGAVTYAATGACSVNPSTGLVTMTAATGTCSVTATKASDTNYNSATSAAATVAATLASQTITFNWSSVNHQYYGNPAINLSLYAGGGGSGNPVTFTWMSGPCLLSGPNNSTVALTGAGYCTINADQAGNGNYNAASRVSSSFLIDSKLLASPGSGKVGLTWNYYTGATGYTVYKLGPFTSAPDCSAQTGYSIAGTTTANSFLVAGPTNPLTNGRYYCFYVTATGPGLDLSHTLFVSAVPKGFGP